MPSVRGVRDAGLMLSSDSVQSVVATPTMLRESDRIMDSLNTAFSGKPRIAGSPALANLGAKPPRGSVSKARRYGLPSVPRFARPECSSAIRALRRAISDSAACLAATSAPSAVSARALARSASGPTLLRFPERQQVLAGTRIPEAQQVLHARPGIHPQIQFQYLAAD